jgi:hypothetical protein
VNTTDHSTMHEPSPATGAQQMDHREMARAQQERFLWTYFANITLGLWLAASAVTLGYGGGLAVSDTVTGIGIAALGTLALFRGFDFWGRWGVCFAGIWLLAAPLVFWADSAAAYANDTLVGSLVIAFAVLVPMMPGMAHHMAMMKPGPDMPPGWTYNPSSWWQRGPVIALALVSFVLSRYLAAYQLGHIGSAWDPFFGNGTENILNSSVSNAWPISDAGLGSFAYLLEALSGFMGNQRRWRTMPWMVLMFGFLVIPLGATSIVLVILQPVMVGDWCSICLVTAVLMLAMIPLAIDEVAAMLQFMAQAKHEGQPLWRTFWVGGTLRSAVQGEQQGGQYGCPMHPEVTSDRPGKCPKCGMDLQPRPKQAGIDTRSPKWDSPRTAMAPAMTWGVSLPWQLLASTAVGLWLLAAPDILGSGGSAADSDRIAGALVAVVAVIAMAEVVRPFRFVNVALAAWLVLAPWFLGGATSGSLLDSVVAGLVLLPLSLPRGPIKERYGPLDRYVAEPHGAHFRHFIPAR